MAFRFTRAVRFEDVDAARIVFFARYFNYCHEAMEAFFAALPDGYPHLILKRGVGFPVVHLESDFSSPLRYGDVFDVDVSVKRIGGKSCTFCYAFTNAGAPVAMVTQVVVATDLATIASINLPDDVRALLAQHLVPAE
jgi:4-hydroxybenzoyl-CoA thioesterase